MCECVCTSDPLSLLAKVEDEDMAVSVYVLYWSYTQALLEATPCLWQYVQAAMPVSSVHVCVCGVDAHLIMH